MMAQSVVSVLVCTDSSEIFTNRSSTVAVKTGSTVGYVGITVLLKGRLTDSDAKQLKSSLSLP